MKITYFAHACFGVEARGLRVLLDPYEPGGFGGRVRYTPVPGTWDVVIVSHDHRDHDHVAASFGTPAVLRGPGRARGLELRCLEAPHGDAGGTLTATTRMGRFELEGLALLHPGDVAGPLEPATVAALRPVDVLFLPVGGHFTAGPEEARALVAQLTPRVVIPMHYRTPHADLAIGSLEDFLAVVPWPIRRRGEATVELEAPRLPPRTEIWTLRPLALPPAGAPPRAGGTV